MGVIDRRSEDKSVCLFCLGNKGVAEIIFKEASFFRHLLHPMQSRISFTPIGKISLSIQKDYSSAAISSKATCVFPSRLTEPFSISTFIFILLLSSPLYQEKSTAFSAVLKLFLFLLFFLDLFRCLLDQIKTKIRFRFFRMLFLFYFFGIIDDILVDKRIVSHPP